MWFIIYRIYSLLIKEPQQNRNQYVHVLVTVFHIAIYSTTNVVAAVTVKGPEFHFPGAINEQVVKVLRVVRGTGHWERAVRGMPVCGPETYMI